MIRSERRVQTCKAELNKSKQRKFAEELGPYVLGKMSKSRLVFFQTETGTYDMKTKTN